MKLKKLLKELTPPIALKLAAKKPAYGFFGNYRDWAEAKADSRGYDYAEILEKVRGATLMVRDGRVAYERDSVTFDKKQYSWPVLASLLWIASQHDDKLNVLDFGGSLGSSYFQNIDFLKHLSELRWNVVEQKNFVEVGRKDLAGEHLHFFASIEDCLKDSRPHALLASSVIQYLEKPYEWLEKLISYGFEYIIFDRTAFFADKDRLTVQKVRPGIYDASYPAWFLNEKKFNAIIEKEYKLIADFPSLRGEIMTEDMTAAEKGSTWRKR